MKQTFDLNKMGLTEISEFEMENIEGGEEVYSWYQFGHAVGQYILTMSVLIAQ